MDEVKTLDLVRLEAVWALHAVERRHNLLRQRTGRGQERKKDETVSNNNNNNNNNTNNNNNIIIMIRTFSL